MKNTRAKGRKNELKTAKELVKAGFHVERMNPPPRRSKGHVDFFERFDVIAVDPLTGMTRYIQVKSNRMPSPAYRDYLSRFCVGRKHCTIELWIWYDRVKVPRVLFL